MSAILKIFVFSIQTFLTLLEAFHLLASFLEFNIYFWFMIRLEDRHLNNGSMFYFTEIGDPGVIQKDPNKQN